MYKLARAAICAVSLLACNDATQPTLIPDAPQNVFVSARLNAIELSWIDASENEEIFVVEVATDDGPFLLLGNFPKNTTSIQYTDPQPGHTYRFRLSACNRAGCSTPLERTVNTDNWLKPTIMSLNATTTGPTGLVITVVGGNYGMPVDVRVVLRRADAPQVFWERSETVGPVRGETLFFKQYFFGGLEQGVEYTYQASLTNQFGAEASVPSRAFIDYTRPQVLGVTITSIAATHALFEVVVRPGGLATTVFPSVVPVDSAHVARSAAVAFVPASSDGAVRIAALTQLNLQPNTHYKARFTVTNEVGSAISGEVKFTTLP